MRPPGIRGTSGNSCYISMQSDSTVKAVREAVPPSRDGNNYTVNNLAYDLRQMVRQSVRHLKSYYIISCKIIPVRYREKPMTDLV